MPCLQVRCTALGALARLPGVLQGSTDHYGEVVQLLLLAAADSSQEVTDALLATVLPEVLAWDSQLLLTSLLPQASRACACGPQR